MDRRLVIKQMGVAGSLSLLPSTLFFGCKSESYQLQFLSESQYTLLNELSEVILPETTKSPGAKTAKTTNFLDSYIFHCYNADQKMQFQEDVDSLTSLCNSTFNKSFIDLSDGQKQSLISTLEQNKSKPYVNCKPMILFSYFTSEVGMTQALRYVSVPGRYEGNVLYSDEEKAWAI